jgi:hypothetical protein
VVGDWADGLAVVEAANITTDTTGSATRSFLM